MKRTALITALVAASTLGLMGQGGKDPFSKKNAPPVESGGSAGAKRPGTLMFTFETWALPPAELERVVSGGVDGKRLRESLLKLESEGRARLQWTGALPTRSGQRAKLESVDELWFLEPRPAEAGEMIVKSRNCGDTLEIDPVISPDESLIDLNISVEDTVFSGFRNAGKTLVPSVMPVAEAGEITLAVVAEMDEPTLVGTYSQAREGLSESCVVLARGRIVQHLDEVTAADSGDAGPPTWQLVFRVYAIDRTSARDLLHESVDGDRLLEQVKERAGAGAAVMERMMVLKTRSGQRAKVLGQGGDAFQSPGITGEKRPAFEKAELGWQVEVDPVVLSGGKFLSVNYAVRWSEFSAALSGDPALEDVPPTPIYAKSTVTTSVIVPFGHTVLAGTLNRPRASGVGDREDDGKTRLVFLEAQVE